MLNALRQFTKSRVGVIVVFIVLGVIALAFAAGDVTGIRNWAGGGGSGGVLAKVGDQKITEEDLRQRINQVMDNLRRSGRSMTMAELIEQGGVEYALQDAITSAAAEEFANKYGMQVSTRLIDGEIADIPDFRTVDGKFDQKKFEAMIGQRGLTPQRVRDMFSEARYTSWVLNRDQQPPKLPKGLLLPYASLQLEERSGAAALVRRGDQPAGADPDDKALAAFYNANKARYSTPERRVLAYALVKPDQFKDKAAATDAEVADAYKRSGDRYAAKEKRTVKQLTLIDQATANAVAAEVKGGKSLDQAAKERGLEVRSFDAVEKAEMAKEATDAVANAAFGAEQGTIAGPVRSNVGWAVVRVEKVEKIAAKTLAEAHDELAGEISKRNEINALANLRQQIDDGIGDGRTFDEIMRDTKLAPVKTGTIAATGADPEDPASKPDPAIAEIVRAGFATPADEREPQLIQVGAEGGFALVTVDKVVPASPKPLDSIKDRVLADYRADQQLKKAREIAEGIVKKVNSGTEFPKAVAEGGANRVPVQRFKIGRRELRQGLPPYVPALFQLSKGKAKLVPIPDGEGYFVAYLDEVVEHDASEDAQLMGQAQQVLGQAASQERAQQFLESVKKDLGVTENKEAIAAFKAKLSSGN